MSDEEREIENNIAPKVRRACVYTRAEFLTLCRWKSPRTQSLCADNDEAFVAEVTRIALSAKHEQLRIEVLTLLRGVGWPTASVLLHFGHRDPYPILDFRALWSLGVDVPKTYSFEFWWGYVECCRRMKEEVGVSSMREFDRALWQHSKDEQE